MVRYDIVIAGGGIVGLATAYSLLRKHPKTKLLLLEKEPRLAAHQTSRNSGVIHSGIYYKPGSLKATNCRRGYQLLLEYCQNRDVPREICGKLIVATERDELSRLETLYERGQANRLEGLKWVSQEEISRYEPSATGLRALHVPETGIIDYAALALQLADDVRNLGGEIKLGEKVLNSIASGSDQVIVSDKNDYAARIFCGCAGLHSDRLASLSKPDLPLRIIPFRGEYYELVPSKRNLVRNLIYPVPDPAFPFLGVHFTRMIGGGVEAGPNAVLALGREAYTWSQFNLRELRETLAWPGFWSLARKYWKTGCHEIHRSLSKAAFTKALQKLIPSIQEDDLVPAQAGIRAQACHSDGSLLDDFYLIQDSRSLHVCNAPSPAATSSLAIGETIAERLTQ